MLLKYRDKVLELYGGEPETTNNRMELMAAIRGLQALKRPSKVMITTDSQYVFKGISEWLPNWIRRNWKTSANTPVKNADLWRQLSAAQDGHEVHWNWIRGHTGHPENERADRLANRGIDELLMKTKRTSHAPNRA